MSARVAGLHMIRRAGRFSKGREGKPMPEYEVTPPLKYYYPESIKKSQKKYREDMPNRGKARLYPPYVDKASKDKILKILKHFRDWDEFLLEVIDRFSDVLELDKKKKQK